MTSEKFKFGDKVTAVGRKGIVIQSDKYSCRIAFINHQQFVFANYDVKRGWK